MSTRPAADDGRITISFSTLHVWEALALRLVLPAVDASRFRSLTADEDAAVVTGLFTLLGQFRESRTSSDHTRTYRSTRIAPAREVSND
jgi:hypothetical protein